MFFQTYDAIFTLWELNVKYAVFKLQPSSRQCANGVFSTLFQVLESFKIMDYSLLLGVHLMDQSQREGGEPGQAAGDGKRPVGQRVLYSTAMESIQGDGKAAEALTTDDT